MMANFKLVHLPVHPFGYTHIKTLNFFFIFFLISISLFAQNTDGRLVEGRVLDPDGIPLPGASVILVDTKTGSVTDFDGHFVITITDDNYLLEFRYIGYHAQVVDARNRSNMTIELELDQNTLDEVVVIGYGEQSKRNVTGAISKNQHG